MLDNPTMPTKLFVGITPKGRKDPVMTDLQVIASVVRYLQAEAGAVSCNVHLPSGKNVVVYVDGTVKY
jgi:hypothetical protein